MVMIHIIFNGLESIFPTKYGLHGSKLYKNASAQVLLQNHIINVRLLN